MARCRCQSNAVPPQRLLAKDGPENPLALNPTALEAVVSGSAPAPFELDGYRPRTRYLAVLILPRLGPAVPRLAAFAGDTAWLYRQGQETRRPLLLQGFHPL